MIQSIVISKKKSLFGLEGHFLVSQNKVISKKKIFILGWPLLSVLINVASKKKL